MIPHPLSRDCYNSKNHGKDRQAGGDDWGVLVEIEDKGVRLGLDDGLGNDRIFLGTPVALRVDYFDCFIGVLQGVKATGKSDVVRPVAVRDIGVPTGGMNSPRDGYEILSERDDKHIILFYDVVAIIGRVVKYQ